MSAIFGILRFDGAEASARDLERMSNTLSHRGPDGRKFIAEGALGLGHGLMRVNKEDAFEAQPLRDRDAGLTLVADCRIDNREELAKAFGLSADQIRDMPDSAFILRAYKKWGENCAEHLLGDFAFAIWDGRAKKLHLARDHMGQRCVHYYHGQDFFAFSTEVKGLWALADVPRKLSEAMIGSLLLGGLDNPPGATLYEEIFGLPGGTAISVSENGGVSARTFWEPRADSIHVGRDEDYYIEAYRRIMQEVVSCRLRRLTRVPALCFSGGFDSGIIATLAGPVVTARGTKLVTASSVRSASEPVVKGDARAAVEAFSRHLPHLDVHYYERQDETFFTDIEQSFLTTEFAAGNNYVRRGLFSIARAAGARFIMDGHGGDYTVNFRGQALLGRFLRVGQFRRFIREFRERMRVTGHSPWRTFRNEAIPALTPAWAKDALFTVRRGFKPLWATRAIARNFALKLFSEGKATRPRVRGVALPRGRWRTYSSNVLRVQAQSATAPLSILAASYGLDFSRPFHDKRVVELALSIPEDLYFKHGLERHLARHAFGDVLPRDLLDRAPGNYTDDPAFFRAGVSAAPSALEDVVRLDRNGRLSRYVDFDNVRRTLALIGDQDNPRVYMRLAFSLRAVAMARFVAWFEGQNS